MSGRRVKIARGPLAFAVMLAFFLLAPQYSTGTVSEANFTDILTNFADTGPIALGVGIGMLVGEFDISIVATYALGAMVVAKLGGDPVLDAAIAAALGAVIGGTQGLIVAWLRINAVPVTLGGFLVVSGIVSVVGHGVSVTYPNFGVTEWITKPVLWAATPAALIVMGIFAIVGAVMRYTRIGREVRAIGGDRRAATISGVPVRRTLVATMALGGLIAGLGGAIHAYTSFSAVSDVSFDQLLAAVTAVVVGGVSLAGGEGKVGHVFVGVLVMALFSELLAVTNANPYAVTVATGSFLIVVALATPEVRNALANVPVTLRERGIALSRGPRLRSPQA